MPARADAVVITGAGLVCSLGESPVEVWDSLLAGRSGIGRIEDFDAAGFGSPSAAQVKTVPDVRADIHPQVARSLGKHLSLLLKSAQDAFASAGLINGEIPGEDIGFFAGMGMVDYRVEDLLPAVLKSLSAEGGIDYDRFFSGGYNEIYPLWPLATLNSVAFCQVAIQLRIRGENGVFVPHADAGLLAVAEAVRALREGKCRAVLVSGTSEEVSPLSLARAKLAGVLGCGSPGAAGNGGCRPFSSDSTGTVLGEGSGSVVLERLSSAGARGAQPRAAVTGFGMACGPPEKAGYPGPDAIGAAIETALAESGHDPADIDLILAHGDGTADGDGAEGDAISRIFSGRARKVSVYPSKGALGNMFAASPLADVILASEILKTGKIPPALTGGPLPWADRFELACGGPTRVDAKHILVHALSSEGQCAALVIEEL